jgi:A/G-specific DNA-adenine glycosylase (EC 3.2.2.-)
MGPSVAWFTSSCRALQLTMQPLWQDDDTIVAARESLIDWYEGHHRSLPWRATSDPYHILVSEVMSQQTQLSRVEGAYHAFLDRWPTLERLATTPTDEVVGFWTRHSLGYNRRARYLHAAAAQIIAEFDGVVPRDPERLQQLPGVGPYTANAVASFAYNTPAAVLDTNVRRVLHRLGPPASDRDDATVADRLMPSTAAGVWNNAIMELGSQVCTPTPRCDGVGCPLRQWCHAYQTGDFSTPKTPQQPSFEGSRRQLRGQIVNILATEGAMPVQAVRAALRARGIEHPDPDRLASALDSLVEDHLIRQVDGAFEVA